MHSEIDLLKLRAALADITDIEEQLKQLRNPQSGDSLIKKQALKRKKKKLLIAIDLFENRERIPALERAYEHNKTPEAKRLAKAQHEGQLRKGEERAQIIAQGRAMGSGGTLGTWRREATSTKAPTFIDPEVVALAALTGARQKCADLETELRNLSANDQEWRALVSPGLNLETTTPDADMVRASFGSFFLKKAELLRDSSINEARDTIQRESEIISDQDALFEFKHETLHSGLMAWLASVGQLVHIQVSVLTQIVAKGRGSYCERGQEARWARMEVEGLLLRSFGQDIACGKAWIYTELSAVQQWSRLVCEHNSVVQSSDPWAAPAWYEHLFKEQSWIEDGRPERLTVEQTERTVELYQSWFTSQLQDDLNDAEDRARLELAHEGEAHDRVFSIAPKSKASISLDFNHGSDYRAIVFRGKEYSLTRNQATIVRMLHEAKMKGTPAVGKGTLLEAIEAETSRVRDSFKKSPLWGTLIIPNRVPRGTYQLDLT